MIIEQFGEADSWQCELLEVRAGAKPALVEIEQSAGAGQSPPLITWCVVRLDLPGRRQAF
jgi:hypothetical protein